MTTDPVAVRASKAAFHRACQALDELIILTLARGPLKKHQLRHAVAPFGDQALDDALARLLSIGEIAGEGQTTARVYRLVQLTAIAPAPAVRTVKADGIEYVAAWPLPSNPKAPPSALTSGASR